MKKVIITGGAGYIGSHTVVSLYRNGFLPVIVDNFSNSHKIIIHNLSKYLNFSYQFVNLDCSNIFSVDPTEVCGIIHFAACKSVGESVSRPLWYYKNNLESLLWVLNYIQTNKINNFVFSSSCTVYGRPEYVPVDEGHKITSSPSPYGQTKVICERIIDDWKKNFEDVNVCNLRYFNPIGAMPQVPIGEYPKQEPENLVSRLMNYASGKGMFCIHGNDYDTHDGSAVRDYLDVGDLANSHVEVLKYMEGKKGIYKKYNVGTGKGTSVFELVNAFKKISGLNDLQISVGPKREGDIDRIYGDASLLHEDIGYKCFTSMETSLENAWKWQKYINENNN